MQIMSRILVSSTALIACGVFLVEAATFDAGDPAWALSLDRRAAGDIHDVAELGDHLFVAVSTIVGRMEPAMTERLEFDDVVEIEGTPRYLFALPHALAILTAPSRANEYTSRSERENPWHIELRDPVMLSRLIGRLELDIEVVDATRVGEHIFVLGFRGDWASAGVIIAIRLADHEVPSLVAERSIPGMVGDRIGGLTGDGDRLYAIVESAEIIEVPEDRSTELVSISIQADRFLEPLGSAVIGDGSTSYSSRVLDADGGRVLVSLLDDFDVDSVILAMDDPAEPRMINHIPMEGHAGILRGDIALIARSSGVLAFDVSRRDGSVGPAIGSLPCPSFFTEPALFALEGSVYFSCGDLSG